MDYYLVGLTITGIISGLAAGFIGAGAEVINSSFINTIWYRFIKT